MGPPLFASTRKAHTNASLAISSVVVGVAVEALQKIATSVSPAMKRMPVGHAQHAPRCYMESKGIVRNSKDKREGWKKEGIL